MNDYEREIHGTSGRKRSRGGLIPLETETSWFVLVNLLDFVVTYRLIGYGNVSGMQFHEANPLAGYFLNHWGAKGLFGFKLLMVLFVCGLAQYIYRHRPDLARLLLILGTCIVGVIVAYSVRLYFHPH